MHKPPAAADRLLPSELSQPEIIAGVDLGSNSFHMVVGELRHGQLAIIDRIRETVRLAEGLSETGELSADARKRSLDCLARFGQRLRDMHAGSVRAAGTATVRRARDDNHFIAEAEELLGHPIEIISGLEEARLIYGGVTHSLPPTDGLRLVADIGGGSTEVILGQAAQTRAVESMHMGCVTMTERFFPGGVITAAGFEKARLAARLELRPVKAFFRGAMEFQAIGTSGTIRATHAVAQELGLIEAGVSLATVEKLIEKVLEFKTVQELSLKGLSERRAQVWPGGLSILAEVMNTLRIPEMRISDGALREGLMYDLLGRLQHEDARERTVQAMAARFQIDEQQASRVAAMAARLHEQTKSAWGFSGDLSAKMLDWSARLHEIGLDISHDGYQRHGAYIAENADMPGFPQAEQRFLAIMIGGQRYPIDVVRMNVLPRGWRLSGLRLLICLRLAVLLNRSRSFAEPPEVKITVDENRISLRFDAGWLAANPLTVADLEREKEYLSLAGYELTVQS